MLVLSLYYYQLGKTHTLDHVRIGVKSPRHRKLTGNPTDHAVVQARLLPIGVCVGALKYFAGEGIYDEGIYDEDAHEQARPVTCMH